MASSGFLGEPHQGISGTLQEYKVHGELWGGKHLRALNGQHLRRCSKWAIALCQAHYGMFRLRIKGRDKEGLDGQGWKQHEIIEGKGASVAGQNTAL